MPEPVMLTLRTHLNDEVMVQKAKAKPTFNQSTGDGVSWAAWTWNPITGCLHGCKYCYARAIAARFPNAFPVGFTPIFREDRLDAPANTKIPAAHQGDPDWERVFVTSMGDGYGRWVPQEWIDRIHAAERASPWWQYIHLSKFPDRFPGLDFPPGAWVGTSVDEQKRVRIAERAMAAVTGVKVKWLSLEPLKEPLVFADLTMFDWIVIGSQTRTIQPGGVVEPAFAPPAEWVLRITHQAREANIPVHWKPNLRSNPGVVGSLGTEWHDRYPSGVIRP
jgi:protein gp37